MVRAEDPMPSFSRLALYFRKCDSAQSGITSVFDFISNDKPFTASAAGIPDRTASSRAME